MDSKWVELPGIPNLEECRVYQRQVEDGHLTVIVGNEKVSEDKREWHLSISHRRSILGPVQDEKFKNISPEVDQIISLAKVAPIPGRIPTWDEIKDARYEFVPDDVNMAMMLPPKRLYMNLHPTTMHLYEIPVEFAC